VLTIILPFDCVVPTWTQLGIAIAVGFVYAAAHWLVIIGYRSADASLLAPYSYFQLVFVAAVGIVVFQELPDIWTVAGIGIIIASGIYNAQHERSRRAGLQRAAKAVP